MSVDNAKTYDESYVRNFKTLMASLHTTLPGIIESYDGKRMASVKPQLQRSLTDGTFLALPIIEEVPVVFPGGDEFGMTWPLKKGTPVMIHFAERSIEEWLKNGVDSKPIDPRRFSLTDAIAVPGLFHSGNPFPVSDNEDFSISYKNVTIVISKDGKIKLNGDTKKFVTFTELDTALQAFKTSIESSITSAISSAIIGHTHAGVTPGPSATAPGVGAGTVPPISVDISASETQTIETGG